MVLDGHGIRRTVTEHSLASHGEAAGRGGWSKREERGEGFPGQCQERTRAPSAGVRVRRGGESRRVSAEWLARGGSGPPGHASTEQGDQVVSGTGPHAGADRSILDSSRARPASPGKETCDSDLCRGENLEKTSGLYDSAMTPAESCPC